MKKKLSKILGVGLSLVLVLSLAFAMMPATPAQAAEGNMQWLAQFLPSNLGDVLVDGSQVTDIAVASDGLTIYAINNAANMNVSTTSTPAASAAGWALVKSTNGGQSFTEIDLSAITPAVAGKTANPLGCVAVAPDDPDTAAISVRDGAGLDYVYVTTDGGISWKELPAFAVYTGAYTAGDIDVMDLAVGPARSGCLYDREYLAALADDTAGVVSADVQIIGDVATWATIGGCLTGSVPDVGLYDYMACAFSPTFVGDRSVAVIGADNTTGATGAVFLQIIDTRTNDVTQAVELGPAASGTGPDDYDPIGAQANRILAADIALPSDWDPTFGDGRRTYCSIASITPANDSIYRVNDATCWDLSVGVVGVAWESIAYSGTIEEGILFAGEYTADVQRPTAVLCTDVQYAEDPQSVQPVWKSAKTAPTGTTGQAVVRLAPDFGETDMVFVGTSGAESSFSVSYNRGVSYQQESLIDTGDAANDVTTIDDIKLTPDGSTIFMATDNGAGELSLWKSAASPSGTSFYGWSRIYCATATGDGLISMSPKYGAAEDGDTALIFTDEVAGGRMYVSADGGDTYKAKYAPSTTAAVTAVAMQDANVVYVGQAANVYKSTNSCLSFGAPSQLGLGPITAGGMDASAADAEGNPLLLLVGCAAGVYYSTDEGGSFAPIYTGIAGGTYLACADSGYDGVDNNFVYATSNSVAGSVYRYDIGTSTDWEDLIAGTDVADSPISLASNNRVLYCMTDCAATVAATPLAAGTNCNRDLYPFIEPGLVALYWQAMDAWSAVPAAAVDNFTTGDNHLYCVAGAYPAMWAYDDYLATATTTVTLPADGTVLSVDPVSGRAELVTLAWDAMGTGNGLVDQYTIRLAQAGTNFAAYQTVNVNTGGTLDPGAPSITVEAATGVWTIALNGGTAYEWKVRASQQVSGDDLLSGWSTVGTFSVAASTGVLRPEYGGPILQAPTPGAMAVSLYPGFGWAPVPDAVKYEFELSASAATTARGYFIDALKGLTGDNALVTAGWQCDVALDYDTSYFWHVKGIAADGAESIWGTAQFTTIAEAAVPVPPAPPVELPAPVTPAWIWAIVAIGGVLVIVVIVLIVVTRRP